MNKQQSNKTGDGTKSLNALTNMDRCKQEDALNKMTELNNELVNTQRILAKQNAEISRLNQKLLTVNTDLEQFTYVASHDLKEPLRAIIGFMELLKTKYGDDLDDKGKTYFDFAIDGGKRMQKLITDLLELSRTSRQNSAKSVESFSVMLSEAKQNLYKLIRDNEAEIIIQAELPTLKVIRTDIVSLFQNLLGNAIKFRKKEISPVVIVRAYEKEVDWLFSIENNGIGIDDSKLEKIFEIFSRLHTKKEFEGSGIGLAICKKVVEFHGGKIWAESEEGKGSTFYFTISKNIAST
ncbi:MAG: ATP-binding protein [Ferruginibacter sp.]